MLAMGVGGDTPTAYCVTNMGERTVTIQLNSIPSTAYALTADVEGNITQLSGAMSPAFDENYHDILVSLVSADELEKAEKYDKAKEKLKQADIRKGELRLHIAKSAYKDMRQGSRPGNGHGGGNGGGGGVSGWPAFAPPASLTAGDLLLATTTHVVGTLPDVAVGKVMVSGGVGVAPVWSATPTLLSTGTYAITATNAGRGPLHIGMGANGDPVLVFGYNHKADYTLATASEPGLAWMLEANYDDGSGQNKMEAYVQYMYADGSGKYNRPFMTQINRTTNLPTETGLSGGVGGVCMYNNVGSGALGSQAFTVGTQVAKFGPAANESLLPTAIGPVTFTPTTRLHTNEASVFGTAVTDTVTVSQSLTGANTSSPSSLGAIAWRFLGNPVFGRINVVNDNPAASVASHMEFWTTPSGGVVTKVAELQADGKLTLLGTPTVQFGGATSSFPGLWRSGAKLQVVLADGSLYGALEAGSYWVGAKLLLSGNAPAIASGFGGSPSVVSNNGTAAFVVDVGTGGAASSGVITLPAATTGWNCFVTNLTAAAGHRADSTVQIASSTTTVTVENQTKSTGAAVAWVAGDILRISCFAY
jgi:hypothetical protein